jgi:hypothetical protein
VSDQPLIIHPFSSDKQEIENCLISISQALTAHGMILQHGPHGMILAKVQSPALRVSRALAIVRRITPPQVEYAQITSQTDPGKIEVSKPQ